MGNTITRYVDLSGKRFGKVLVLTKNGCNKKGEALWLCRCACGNSTVKTKKGLEKAINPNCGCVGYKHGESYSKELQAWNNIKERCYNPLSVSYPHYGAKGITVCQRWFDSYDNFLADMGRSPSGEHSVDRINNNEGYSPLNCRWATRKEQARNRRNNIFVEFSGERLTLPDFCDRYNIEPKVMRKMVKGKYIHLESLPT